MKTAGTILALCAFQPSAAFLAPATTFKGFTGLASTTDATGKTTPATTTTSASDAVSSFYSNTKTSDVSKNAMDNSYTVRTPTLFSVPVYSILILDLFLTNRSLSSIF